jgi:hypothetical protein
MPLEVSSSISVENKSSTDFSMKILSSTMEALYTFKELTFHWEVTFFLKLFLTKYGNVTPEFSKNLTWKQIMQLLVQRKQIEFVVILNILKIGRRNGGE